MWVSSISCFLLYLFGYPEIYKKERSMCLFVDTKSWRRSRASEKQPQNSTFSAFFIYSKFVLLNLGYGFWNADALIPAHNGDWLMSIEAPQRLFIWFEYFWIAIKFLQYSMLQRSWVLVSCRLRLSFSTLFLLYCFFLPQTPATAISGEMIWCQRAYRELWLLGIRCSQLYQDQGWSSWSSGSKSFSASGSQI